MGVSRDSLIPRVRDLLQDQPYSTTSTTTGTGTTVAVPDGTKWAEGDIGEWQTGTVGYEQFLVTADPVVNDLTVTRGYGGTTAEPHSSGDRIFQAPGFFGRGIQQALEAGIRTLFPFVYVAQDITLAPVGDGTDPDWWTLATEPAGAIIGLISATQVYGTAPHLALVSYGITKGTKVEFDLEAQTDLVADGVGIKFTSGLYHPTNDIVVKVMQPVLGTDAVEDIEDDGRFPVGDYLVTYAAGRLTAAQEITRVASGTDLETSGTVSTGSRMETGRTFLYDAKKQLELLALKYRTHYRPLRMEG